MNNYSFNVIWSDEDKCFMATCPEFPGLSAFGNTPTEAIEEAQVALELFIEQYEEDGEPLPEPRRVQEYSGQTRVRMPSWLHARLAEEAERQNTSLNQLIVSYLSTGVGQADVFEDQRSELRRLIYALSPMQHRPRFSFHVPRENFGEGGNLPELAMREQLIMTSHGSSDVTKTDE